MGLPQAFLSLLPSTITVKKFVGQDQFGNTIFAVNVLTTKALIEPITLAYGETTQGGTEQEQYKVQRTKMLVDTDAGVGLGDQITLGGTEVFYVVEVVTTSGFKGENLYSDVTIEKTERG